MPLQVFGKRGIGSLRDRLEQLLRELENKDPEIEGSVLLRSDGLVMASALKEQIDKDLVAAMVASALNVSSRVMDELHRGNVENIIIRGDKGVVMVIAVDPEVVLSAIAKKNANIGLMLVEMRKTAEKVRKFLEEI